MTRRWVPGKEPTREDVVEALTNAICNFSVSKADIDRMAEAVVRLYKDRIEGKR